MCRFHFSELPAAIAEEYSLTFSSRCGGWERWSGQSRDETKSVNSWRGVWSVLLRHCSLGWKSDPRILHSAKHSYVSRKESHSQTYQDLH